MDELMPGTTNEMQDNNPSAYILSQEMALTNKNTFGGDFEPREAWANKKRDDQNLEK